MTIEEQIRTTTKLSQDDRTVAMLCRAQTLINRKMITKTMGNLSDLMVEFALEELKQFRK